MLPLGMVNLVAVAVVEETRHYRDLSTMAVVITGWVVALVAWFAMASAAPLMTDNRPKLETES
jgi:hypothetical protein